MRGEATVHVTMERHVDCPGDCGLDGRVAVDELIALVRIALGETPAFACPSGDTDGDGAVGVSELIGSVRRALEVCGT